MPYTVTVSHEIKDNKLEVCQAIIKHDFQESNLPLLREALTVPFGKTIENNRILAQTGDAALILILRKYGVEYKRNVDPELTVCRFISLLSYSLDSHWQNLAYILVL